MGPKETGGVVGEAEQAQEERRKGWEGRLRGALEVCAVLLAVVMRGCQLGLGRDVFPCVWICQRWLLALGVPVLPRAVLLWPSPGRACWLHAGPGLNCCRLGRQPQPPQCPSKSCKGTGKTHPVSRQQSRQTQPLSLLEN